MKSATEPDPTRRMAYVLFIVIAAGSLAGRILAVEQVYEPSVSRPAEVTNGWRLPWPDTLPTPVPTFSSNDRSRWATVRALVDDGTYVVGHRDQNLVVASGLTPLGARGPVSAAALATAGYHLRTGNDTGIVFEDGWKTIDKVMKPDTCDFYSSKPPLLPTLMAGEYWVLQKVFGWKIKDQYALVVRIGLITVNWLPMLIYLVLLARLVERYGTTDWGRLYVLAAGCFGTMLTTFAITFNNHTVGAVCALFALCAVMGMWGEGTPVRDRRLNFAVGGGFAGLCAAAELPATSFLVALFVLLLVWAPRPTLLWFLPAALIPVAAFLYTNHVAVGEWLPVYSKHVAVGEWLPVYSKLDTAWYQYEGSHWTRDPAKINTAIDFLREDKPTYALNILLGHHGLFSLAPIWLLALVGMFLGTWRFLLAFRVRVDPLALVGALGLVLTVVLVGFYVFITNNYGGWTNGPRWLMWLTPFLLLALLPVADRIAPYRWGRGLGYVLLALSILSVSYRDWNPWRHPWIYNFLEAQGWLGY
jgi:hypothetical protein